MNTAFRIGALLCDVDNVIRVYDDAALVRAEREVGVAAGTTAAIAFAPETALPLLVGEATPAQWVDLTVEAFGRLRPEVPASAARMLGTTLTELPFRADPEVVRMLREAREQTTVVLVTNASVQLEDDLRLLGLTDLAHQVVSSARVGLVKPDPRIFRLAADRAHVPPERCLFVDDTLANVEAARALGMTALHYRTPGDLSDTLSKMLSPDRS